MVFLLIRRTLSAKQQQPCGKFLMVYGLHRDVVMVEFAPSNIQATIALLVLSKLLYSVFKKKDKKESGLQRFI